MKPSNPARKRLSRKARELSRLARHHGEVQRSKRPGAIGTSRIDTPFQRALQPRFQLAILAALVLLAFALRLYRLGEFPDTVLGDEADNAQYAVRILYGKPPLGGLFGIDWTPQPAFSIYKQAAFLALFGFNVLAIRLPSALGSALTLIPFYFLLRRQLSITASLLATALLASNVWYLNFSRSGWNNIDVCGYMLLATACLLLALDSVNLAGGRQRLTWILFAVAGFAVALGLYSYPSGRAIPLAVAAFFPVAWWLHARHRRQVLLGYGILAAVCALVAGPGSRLCRPPLGAFQRAEQHRLNSEISPPSRPILWAR